MLLTKGGGGVPLFLVQKANAALVMALLLRLFVAQI
jgi:hypothetical protein